MRIACIHIPQFALQCATRLDPSLRGAPVAVVSGVEPGRDRAGVLHAPIVLACSRAAYALGVRLGMTATAARSVAERAVSTSAAAAGGSAVTTVAREGLTLVTAEPTIERESVRAVADALLALAPVVDLGGRVGAGGAHLALYAEVPAKTRGTAFGDRLVDLLEDLGYAARIGIADDRFTAWVAAAHAGVPARVGAAANVNTNANTATMNEDRSVISVPRGGSAAFLSPRPLSLLAITPEVQHMLESLGIRTLGEFASLPAPSIARPLEADYQALARGDSGSLLRPYTPDAPVREEIVVSSGNVLERDGSVGGPAAIALIARRTALRLAGRGRSAARIEVVVRAHESFGASLGASLAGSRAGSSAGSSAVRSAALGSAIDATEIPVSLDIPVVDAENIARVLGPVLDATASMPGAWRLRVVVAGEALADAAVTATDLFADGSAPFARVAMAANSNSIYARNDEELIASQLRTSQMMSPSPSSSSSPRSGAQTSHNSSHSPMASLARSQAQAQSHASESARRDNLSMVLASTGTLFALSAPGIGEMDAPRDSRDPRDARGDRRDMHRTRRGKQRRVRPTAPVQSRLFDAVAGRHK